MALWFLPSLIAIISLKTTPFTGPGRFGVVMSFDSLGLNPDILRAVAEQGYVEPTPIQQQAIPAVLQGRDLMASAQTGTGKTAGFTLPLLQHLITRQPHAKGRRPVRALILTPTRELAAQIGENVRDYSKYLNIRSLVVFGGVSINPQMMKLRGGVDVLVATPGRLLDLEHQNAVKLDQVEILVLDEADRMLDMGFIHDVTRILDKLASRRNLGMFSATISREVMDISWMYQRDPEEITVQAKEENKPDIAQYRIDVGQNDKAHVMAQIIRAEGHERVMAFCNTKGMTERLKAFLMMEGLEADCIHGDIPQKKREAVMARFRRGELPIFVATDVAARGIDVDDVDAVFNYDVPLENEYYVHRIGRTGRAKRRGVAYTLVSDYPSGMRLDEIAKFTGNEVKKAHLDAEGKLVED